MLKVFPRSLRAIVGAKRTNISIRRTMSTQIQGINEEVDGETVVSNLKEVLNQIELTKIKCNYGESHTVNLVAVSKTKPIELIKSCYDAGHRDFGENYVQELIDKSKQLPSDIRWHFIGHLQTNKAKQLTQIPNLYIIETIDSLKLAKAVDKHWGHANKLNIFVQVNTSGEESKSGVHPTECVQLVKSIIDETKNLKFQGLMTIGAFEVTEDQPDFTCLRKCREEVAKELSIPIEQMQLSMGMSHDFIQAIEMGASNVRVGSTIFGKRYYPNKG